MAVINAIKTGRRAQWVPMALLGIGLALAGCARSTAPPALTAVAATPQATVTFGIALPTRAATPTAEVLGTVPTRTPAPLPPTATPTIMVAVRETATPVPTPTPGAALVRFGVGGTQAHAVLAHAAGLPFTHLLDWKFTTTEQLPPDVTYWRMVRTSEEGLRQPLEQIEAVARANPGSIWIIGNEPDVRWQDDVQPESYARIYGETYAALKAADPTAQIAPAGVAQGTPLRLAYLDRVLAAYLVLYGEPLPADLWTVHAFTLREERDSWGVDIPAGMTESAGELYEIEQHDDLELFTQNIVNFRRWMAQNGYRDLPLAVTEMGILLPNDYGFPPERVQQYMREAYDILLALRDPEIGLPGDDDRLVQTWFWYILYDPPDRYPTANLLDPATGQLTPLGETQRGYLGD